MKKLVILFSIFLTGCSFKSLVIPNLAFLLADRIDSSLHLYNEQEYRVREKMKSLLSEEKGRIADLKKYLNTIDIKKIDGFKAYAFFSKNYFGIATKVNAILAKEFSTMDKNQIEKFRKSTAEDNKDIKERSLERKPEDFYKRYRYFFGELTVSQKDLINSNMDLFRDLAGRRLSRREELQKDLFKYLLIKDQKKKEKLIKELFDKNADVSKLTPERKKSIYQFREFVSSLTPKQEAYFKKKIIFFNEWIDAYLKQF